MTTSHNDISKCLSGLIRCLLCSGSLPTHPSDLITEPNNRIPNFNLPQKHSKTEITNTQAPQTPGIVARLMGLDSLPDLNWVQKQRPLDSILRSRSVNSVNYFPELDLTCSGHRRVRTSASFREVPPRKNDDFFVLCFERVSGKNEISLSGSKSEVGFSELKEKESKTERNRGNSRERKGENQGNKKGCMREKEPNNDLVVLCFEKLGGSSEKSKSDMGFEEMKQSEGKAERNRGCLRERKVERRENLEKKKGVCKREKERNGVCENVNLKGKSVVKSLNRKEKSVHESKFEKKKKIRDRSIAKKVESVCDNLDTKSNPVSVVDPNNILSHHENTSSGDSRSRAAISNGKKKPRSTIANFENPSSNPTRKNFIADDNVLRSKRNRDDKPKKTKQIIQYYSELKNEIFRLTEEETQESNWVFEKVIKFEDVEEICMEFGQQILDLLFLEVVDELVGCDSNKFVS